LIESLPLVTLAIAGLAAGFINAIAGGGSLLTLPALIFTGLDAHAANATNRIAVLFQSGAALVSYGSEGAPLPAKARVLAAPAALSAAAGAYASTLLSEEHLRMALAVALIIFLLISLRSKPARTRSNEFRITPPLILGICGIGFYAGFLQAGMGILTLLLLGWGFGMHLLQANVLKVYLLGSLTLVALLIFALHGAQFAWERGILLAVCTSLGAFLGARLGARISERAIRNTMLIAVAASAAKLVADL